VNTTLTWPDNFRRKLKFSLHDIWYPEVSKQRNYSSMKAEFELLPQEFFAVQSGVQHIQYARGLERITHIFRSPTVLSSK
jgi:hypothetical protein